MSLRVRVVGCGLERGESVVEEGQLMAGCPALRRTTTDDERGHGSCRPAPPAPPEGHRQFASQSSSSAQGHQLRYQ
jgi:hypothetical protein